MRDEKPRAHRCFRDREYFVRSDAIRYVWEYLVKETELHQQQLVQMLVALLAAGLAAVASVLLEKVPPLPGVVFAVGLFATAGYVQWEIRKLPR